METSAINFQYFFSPKDVEKFMEVNASKSQSYNAVEMSMKTTVNTIAIRVRLLVLCEVIDKKWSFMCLTTLALKLLL